MPRQKPRKAAGSPADLKFQSPKVMVRSSRRATLAGPAQLLSKHMVSPVVIIEGDVLGRIKKGLSKAAALPLKAENKSSSNKTGSKHSPNIPTKTVKSSPKPKKVASPKPKKVSPAQRRSLSRAVVSPSKAGNKVAAKKSASKRSPKTAKTTKASPKPKKLVSPKPKKLTSPKPKKVPSKRRSRKTATARSPPKLSPPKQKKSATPKSSQKSPSHSYGLRLRSTPFAVPESLRVYEFPSITKSVSVSRKRNRSESPASKKKPKMIVAAAKQNKSPSKMHTSLKPTGKRNRDIVSEDEERLSPPQKKRLLKSESHSASKKVSAKVANTPFTQVKSKTATGNMAKSGKKEIPVSEQNSTPVRPALSENVSMGWNMSSIKKRLLASITPRRLKENATPAMNDTRPTKSALSPAKKKDSSEKRTPRRQSVRFLIRGKADTVKNLKERSSRKRFCYRMCQYMLLLGLPAAMTVGSVLFYNGFI